MEGGFPGAQSDWATILQMLKSDDEFIVYQGAMEMRDALSYAQENQMHGFTTEQFMDILVKIVNRDPITDLSNEVKFFTIQCLTTLMDIFPTLVNTMVNAGLVKGMTTVLQSSVGFIDLSEACIKAYEKISMENPPAVLKSGAVGVILQQMDFFEFGTQQRIFRIMQKVARHSTCEGDFDTYILPLIPYICMSLTIDNVQTDDLKRIEDLSKIMCEIQESFCIFYSPISDFKKVGEQFDKLLESGVFDIILEHIRQFSDTNQKIQRAKSLNCGNSPTKYGDMDIDNQIDSKNLNQSLNHQTMLNFFRILESSSRYSFKVSNKLFGESSLLKDLGAFLPHDFSGTQKNYNSEDFPLIMEVINLLNSVFSDKDMQTNKEEEKEAESPVQKRLIVKREFEGKKREYQLQESNRIKIVQIAEILLPRIFFVYESTINAQFRIKTLQVIDKTIALFDDSLLKNFIEPKQFANFIFQIIGSKHSSSLDVSLKITKKVMDCSPVNYSLPLIREGVSQMIKDISTQDKFKKFMGIGADVDIADKSFDLDIHEVKEALHLTRINNPDDHQARDFYERRLLDLVEKQKHPGQAQGAGTSSFMSVFKSASKKESPLKGQQEKDANKKNIAIQIIEEAQELLTVYFENDKFIQMLEQSSPMTQQQLQIQSELTQISTELCNEATQIQNSIEEMPTIRRLFTRISELLTLEDYAITSYEFRHSKLLFALELLLTKSPNQARVILDQMRSDEKGEETKQSETETNTLTKKESQCLIYRFKLVAHILLMKKSQSSMLSPLRALIDLNHKVISENDSFILGTQSNATSGFGGQFSSSGHPSISSLFAQVQTGSGDYEQCISALRQLQKRVTVNLVYDPKKNFLKPSPKKEEIQDELEQIKQEEIYSGEEDQFDAEDSLMEDLTPKDNMVIKTKAKSHHPALLKLAASPNKIDQQKINYSKVYMKRDYLYSELKSIPVTVEQQSNLQILEDFLRNKIKTMDNVKGLKFDYGFGDRGPQSSASPFGNAFGGHYQSITQKILRKNLGNAARKILDTGNTKLAKILNSGSAYKIKQIPKKKKKDNDGYDEEMDEIVAAPVNPDKEKEQNEDEESGEEDSQGYGEMEEEEEDEQEMAAEIEKQRLLDLFVEELPDEIISSTIPEDQQHILVKILTRQHTFMMDQLKMNYEDAAAGEGNIDEMGQITGAYEDEMYRLEEKLEDFQETMERVQARFFDKKSEQKKTSPAVEEEKKTGEDEVMADESVDKNALSSEHIVFDDDKELYQIKMPETQPKMKLENKPEELIKEEMLEQILEKEFLEQDKKIEKALAREKDMRKNEKNITQVGATEVSEQTNELMALDLEELIKEQGEDIEFEFYYEGKLINLQQTIYEIIKDSESKRKQIERAMHQAEQVKLIQQKEAELKSKAKDQDNEAQRASLKKESDRLKDLFNQLSSQFGPGKGGPGGIFSSMNAYKICFCIKDKSDDLDVIKRQRLDSLVELTNSSQKRLRTKSEAVQDISSSSICEFVQDILDKEFKVFEEVAQTKTEDPTAEKKTEEKKLLEQSLKVLKVLNFLYSNQDLISTKGIKFIMKSNQENIKEAQQIGEEDNQITDFDEPGFSDIDLKTGFSEIQASVFHHQKLDSYLQKSIKDPYNLVQGAISTNLQQIFSNCPFLFPFSTKQLYFKLVSFISAIDVHRSIYFLRQYIKQQSGGMNKSNEKDSLKKIAKQKVSIKRDQLIPSAFQLLAKIDKRSFLEFEFQGEEGTGLGPTLEFYDNIADEFKKWAVKINDQTELKMWRQATDNLLFPSPVCIRTFPQEKIKQIYDIYRLCGTIVAKAIVDDRQIDLPISPLFWKLCLGHQLSIFDYQKLDITIFNTLAEFQIIANKSEEIEQKNLNGELKTRQLQSLTLSNGSRVEDYALDFTLPCFSHIELIPGGVNREVGLENAQDYIDLVLHYSFHESVKIQVQAFKKGFNEIFPISSLSPFLHSSSQESELENVVCGIRCGDSEWQNREELMKNIEPDHGFDRKSNQYLNFIKYITEIKAEQRPLFLKFLTGSKRLPIGGFKTLSPHLTLVLKKEAPGQSPDSILPSVMACQNYVKCPQYSSFEGFKAKFDYAVAEGQQNFSLS